MHFCRNVCASLALALAFATPSSAQDPDTVLATVGDTQITLAEVVAAFAGLAPQQQGIPAQSLIPALLDRLISQAALAQQASDPSPLDEAQLRNQERALRASQALSSAISAQITEEAIRAEYEAIYLNVDPQPEFNASHILVESQEEALAILERLGAGEEFAALARELSTGPSGPNGGLLGWFGLGAMVPSFEAAVVALDVGGVSEPVETQFGWHVVTLNDSRMPEAPAFDVVRSEVTQRLEQRLVGDFIDAARGAVEIEVMDRSDLDPEVIKTPGLFQE